MPEPSSRQSAPAPNGTTTTTTTTTTTEAQTSQSISQGAPRTLRLRGGHNATGRSVQWAEDVVDNEGLGRKSSKVCCIYHKPKGVDESSDESSSSSDSDTDSDAEKRRGNGKKARACGHGHSHGRKGGRGEGRRERAPSPNAYEKVPRQTSREEGGKS
ncbi:hypothetical protein EsHS_00002048 [Epichloe bromicola]